MVVVPSSAIGPILFLDMDGVVSVNGRGPASERLQRDRVARLSWVVEVTGCLVVATTSWRRVADPGQLTAWLREAGFTGVVHDEAPQLGDPACPVVRGAEIRAWLGTRGRGFEDVAVLDDWHVPGLEGHLVQCDERFGLTDADAERAVALLLGEEP